LTLTFDALVEACSRRPSANLQNFNPIAQTFYDMCVTKVFHLLTSELTTGPKFTKRGDDAKFHRPALTHAENIPYKNIADLHTNKVTNGK